MIISKYSKAAILSLSLALILGGSSAYATEVKLDKDSNNNIILKDNGNSFKGRNNVVIGNKNVDGDIWIQGGGSGNLSDSFVFGHDNYLTGSSHFVFGHGIKIDDKDTTIKGNLVLGNNVEAKGNHNVVLFANSDTIPSGSLPTVNGDRNIVLGGTNVKGALTGAGSSDNFVVMGGDSAQGTSGVAGGSKYSFVLGGSAEAKNAEGQVVLGWKASTQAANSVALGSYSQTGKRTYTGNVKAAFSGESLADSDYDVYGPVSVGKERIEFSPNKGIRRQIINVAGGTKDHDAVNVGQLKSALKFSFKNSDGSTSSLSGTSAPEFVAGEGITMKVSGNTVTISGSGGADTSAPSEDSLWKKDDENNNVYLHSDKWANTFEATKKTLVFGGKNEIKNNDSYTALGNTPHTVVAGNENKLDGEFNNVFGNKNKLKGNNNLVIGQKNESKSSYFGGFEGSALEVGDMMVFGESNTLKGKGNLVLGRGLVMENGAEKNVILGTVEPNEHDSYDTYKTVAGGKRNFVTFGVSGAKSEGNFVAFGSAGENVKNSIALGGAANASNSVALGAGSVAGAENTVSVGNVTYNGQGEVANADSIVTRKITGVAAGTNLYDAVNLAQLNELKNSLGDVSALAGDVASNKQSIEDHESRITHLEAVGKDVADHSAAIKKNREDIAAHKKETDRNTAAIERAKEVVETKNVEVSQKVTFSRGDAAVEQPSSRAISMFAAAPRKPAGSVSLSGAESGLVMTGEGRRELSGLTNTSWDPENVVADRAATEGQLLEVTESLGSVQNGLGMMDQRIGELDEDVKATTALNSALAGLHPMDYDPKRPTSILASVGNYRDKWAMALGVSHYVRDDVRLGAGISVGHDNRTTANLNIAFKLGHRPSEAERVSYKKASASEVQTKLNALVGRMAMQQKTIDDQREMIEALAKELESLKR